MKRQDVATRLSLLIALAGLLPIALVAAASIEILRRRGAEASHEALRAVATQAAARIGAYVEQQRETLRTVAAAVGDQSDAARRLEEVPLDAPSLTHLLLLDADAKPTALPKGITAEQLAEVRAGREVASAPYSAGLSPALDVCVPVIRKAGRAICATLDLLELQRQVQRIRFGDSGRALAFDHAGRVIAAGDGSMRAAVLSGETIPESASAVEVAHGRPPGADAKDRIAGWAYLPKLGWSIAVEQSASEALRAPRTAQLALGVVAFAALLASVAVGAAQARRVLTELEVEERWRTAGLIASGITHDLGHRLAVLQQTAGLAELGDPTYLPVIHENLVSEVSTLRKFVGDFADLTREAQPAEFTPLELGSFAESVRRSAQPHADRGGVRLELVRFDGELWVHADRYLLERAALNLVYNAIEASADTGLVQLSLVSDAAHARLVVQDFGTGIAPERLAGLFDAFASTKRTGAHIGMGLPNVRRIVLAHGGKVSVESEPGRGSIFTIELPLAPSTVSA